MIRRKTYNCIEGESSIVDSSLVNVTLLRIEKNDKVYNLYSGDIPSTNTDLLSVNYSPWLGMLIFNPALPFNNGEKIKVVYET